jgi:ribosomal RNA-processing protein 9
MPDSFFTSSKSRKRKRTDATAKRRVAPANAAQKKGRRKAADEELSDHTDDDHGIDDLDLRAGRDDELDASGEEDDSETPAQKRLRLAKLYLESVKDDLGLTGFSFRSNLTRDAAEGEYDAAEIDKEIINARLKQDVLEHAGKMHLFVADLVTIYRY